MDLTELEKQIINMGNCGFCNLDNPDIKCPMKRSLLSILGCLKEEQARMELVLKSVDQCIFHRVDCSMKAVASELMKMTKCMNCENENRKRGNL
jgi:hypothetical protein